MAGMLECEHGVKDGEWCAECNREMKRAAADDLAASGGIVEKA